MSPFRTTNEKVFDDLTKRSTKGALSLALNFVDWQRAADSPDHEILRIPEIGRKRMVYIRSILAFHGFSPSPSGLSDDKEVIREYLLSNNIAGRIAVELQASNRFMTIDGMRALVESAVKSAFPKKGDTDD